MRCWALILRPRVWRSCRPGRCRFLSLSSRSWLPVAWIRGGCALAAITSRPRILRSCILLLWARRNLLRARRPIPARWRQSSTSWRRCCGVNTWWWANLRCRWARPRGCRNGPAVIARPPWMSCGIPSFCAKAMRWPIRCGRTGSWWARGHLPALPSRRCVRSTGCRWSVERRFW